MLCLQGFRKLRRAKAGEQGRGALPLSCGTGMRATWASGPLSALCLSAPRAAAPRCGPGRGGDGGAGRGGASLAGGYRPGAPTDGRRHLCSLLASSPHSRRSETNVSSPLPHPSHPLGPTLTTLTRLSLPRTPPPWKG